MDTLLSLLHGFSVARQPTNLFYCFTGVFMGTLIGVLPGIGPTATIALLLPATFKMDPVSSIIMLSGICYGAMYGGSTTSILLNIPGEASSVVTCLDGYQMARNGKSRGSPRDFCLWLFYRRDLQHHRIDLSRADVSEFRFEIWAPRKLYPHADGNDGGYLPGQKIDVSRPW